MWQSKQVAFEESIRGTVLEPFIFQLSIAVSCRLLTDGVATLHQVVCIPRSNSSWPDAEVDGRSWRRCESTVTKRWTRPEHEHCTVYQFLQGTGRYSGVSGGPRHHRGMKGKKCGQRDSEADDNFIAEPILSVAKHECSSEDIDRLAHCALIPRPSISSPSNDESWHDGTMATRSTFPRTEHLLHQRQLPSTHLHVVALP